MEKMKIEVTSGMIVGVPVPPQTNGATPSEKYLAKRKVAGAKLPVIDVPIPVEEYNEKDT